MTRRLTVLLVLVLGGCAMSTPPQERGAVTEGRTAGKPQGCVTLSSSEKLIILDSESVGFRSGGTIWVNRPGSTCLGLEPTNTLVVETYGTQICRGDHIRVIRPPVGTPGPICILGDFVPYQRL